MKSGLIKNIFGQELEGIYIEQSKRRDELKQESREVLVQLISEMKNGMVQNSNIEVKLINLSDRLKFTKGKRQYGYLQPKLKAMVDNIVDELAKDERISRAYGLWYEMRNEVLNSYMDNLPEPLPLSEQKEFKSIKNMIIKEADNFNKGIISFEEIINDDIDVTDEIIGKGIDDGVKNDTEFIEMERDTLDLFNERKVDDVTGDVYVEWSDDYKRACGFLFGTDDIVQDFEESFYLFQQEAEKGNALAMFNMGRMFTDGLDVKSDSSKAHEWYKKTLNTFRKVENKKPWKYTEYRIGKMYSQGLGTEEDYDKASYWFALSAEERYKFAEYSLGGLYYRGQGVEKSYESAFDLYLKSAKQGFLYADFEVAKMYRDGIGTDKNEIESNKYFRSAFIGFEKLEKQSHDDKIQYRLGWMLQNGIGTEKDIKRAKGYYEKSAKLGNTFACYSFAKLILSEENATREEINKAVEYLKEASENGNQFAQYSLGKIYLNGDFVEKDIYKAIGLFELSSEQDNEYAQFFLDNMDRFYNPSVSLTVSRMFHHMSKIFEDNVPLKSSGVGIKIDSKLMRKLREKKVAQGHKKDDYKQNIEL